jgi:hypothetical protein
MPERTAVAGVHPDAGCSKCSGGGLDEEASQRHVCHDALLVEDAEILRLGGQRRKHGGELTSSGAYI